MIITKFVDVKCSSSNKKIYEEKGYIRNDDSNTFHVKIDDLLKGSHINIIVKCVNCGLEKDVVYKNYVKQTNDNTDEYMCKSCKSIKIKRTHIEKYGVSSVFKLPEYQTKIKNIMLDKYGVENALSNKTILQKMNDNNRIKYDVENISQIQTVKDKKVETLSKTWLDRLRKNSGLNIIKGDYDKMIFTADCDQYKKHTFDISYDLYHNRKEFNSVICTKCHKHGRTIFGNEIKIVNFIKENYDGIIETNTRKIISPYELDIYLPELKLAIELNGFKWHSDSKVGKKYHQLKTDLCNDKGIQLLHFYQDDWIYKENIIKSMILNKLNKTTQKIYARKCIIKTVSNKITKDFMVLNHIQGYTISTYNYALYNDNDILSVISVGNRKISGKNIFELLRYGSKLNTNVIGGFSKLFKFVTNELHITEILTYANKSYSNGLLYEHNEFKYVCDTKPNYYYVINNKRVHRYSFRKDILVKNGADPNKTEIEIMDDKNIIRIYDSGNKKYIWKCF